MDKRSHHLEEGIQNETTKPPIAQSASNAVPDPDEDNLDDLDDLLDDFSVPKSSVAPNEKSSLEHNRFLNEDIHPSLSDTASAEFSKQLQEQMAALMGDVEESPEMKKEIQAMMEELTLTVEGEDTRSTAKAGGVTGSSSAGKPFQTTIQETVERMRTSEEHAAAAAASEDPDEILAQMLKEMQDGGLDVAENEEDFSNMLVGMMEQLTNKDILLEPMEELHDKFPAWMAKNKTNIKEDDLKRYEDQQRLVGEIVEKFHEKTYSDTNPQDRSFIVERMQQMQAAGSPPADLIGDTNAAQEALGELNSGCAQQ